MGLGTGVTGAGAVGQVSASGGFVVFSGYSDNSLTARVSAIDAGYTTTGDFAVFTTNNTTRYLFIQGGATDLVARLSDEDSLSAGLVAITKSGNSIGFGFWSCFLDLQDPLSRGGLFLSSFIYYPTFLYSSGAPLRYLSLLFYPLLPTPL